VVTICTTSLTLSNSTFCPHSVFMCFVWIWEQTAIISLYSINWLVFITEMECVYCAVRSAWQLGLIVVFKGLSAIFLGRVRHEVPSCYCRGRLGKTGHLVITWHKSDSTESWISYVNYTVRNCLCPYAVCCAQQNKNKGLCTSCKVPRFT